jgi:hypothetical protein
MRVHARFSSLALLVGVIAIAALVPAAAQAAVGIEKFVGINCVAAAETCGETPVTLDAFGEEIGETVEPSLTESEAQGYRQAAGHVPYGVTDFMVTHTGDYAKGEAVPDGIVDHVRVDVATGLATSPVAVAQCTMADFGEKEAIEGTGFYAASTCAEGTGPHNTGPTSTVIGEEKATVYVKALGEKGPPPDVALAGTLYNLDPPVGRSALYGAALKLPIGLTKGALEEAFAAKGNPLGAPTETFLEAQQYYAHTLVEGDVEWGEEAKGTKAADYHDYFEVNVSPALPLLRSRQLDYGTAGNGAFITNATKCPGDHTTYLSLEGTEKAAPVRQPYTTRLGLENCNLVPFAPSFSLTASNAASDEADGISAQLSLTRFPEKEIDSAQVQTAVVKLPEGMTLNPSAAAGLGDCTEAQARIHSSTAGTSCPSDSQIGTVSLEVPTLPAGSLTGSVYLGGPESGPITKPPYTVYVDAESARYGVSVRLKGKVEANEATGQLTTTFSENPEQPFTSLTLHFKEGALAPIANPLSCGTGKVSTSLTPVTEPLSTTSLESPFSATGCASPVAFAPTQSTPAPAEPLNAGKNTSFTFTLERAQGQQYLSQVRTVLPAGLVGNIPAVPQCSEAEATAGACSSASQLGSVSVLVGSGSQPYPLTGSVYLTGPYNGAPYGLFISVPVVAGPFSLGNAITRLGISVDQSSGRVIVSGYLPSIVYGGIPVRLRKATISITRQGFMTNPTNCGVLATESTVTGSLGATASLSTPYQVGNCAALAFKPAFGAATSARTSKAGGASLETTINVPAGDANIKSVVVQLPKQLPSRLTTLQKACPEATFAASPYACPKLSWVGNVRANTPTLPTKLTGRAYLVSHGGAAFPDLDLVLQADGVTVILVGNTNIKNGITTTTFATTPDVPVSSITLNLPMAENSALAAYGGFCSKPLVMPTTITGQNGVVFKQNTIIKVKECGVQIVGHKTIGNTAYLTVRTPEAGRISGSGSSLATVYRHLAAAKKATTLEVPLSRAGKGRRKPLSVKVRVGFLPKKKGAATSASTVTVTFR